MFVNYACLLIHKNKYSPALSWAGDFLFGIEVNAEKALANTHKA